MLFDLFFCLCMPMFILYFFFLRKPQEDRFFDDIYSHKLKQIWWLHRKEWHLIQIDQNTIVKRPRTTIGDITKYNGVMLKNFMIDNVHKKSDAFSIDKLYRFRF